MYDASVSQTISRDFALKFTRDSPRSLCFRSSLSLSLSSSLPLFPSSFLSRNFILHSCGVVTPSLPPFAILSAHENRMTRAKTSRGRSSRSMSFLQDGCTLRGDLTCARGETRTYDMDTYVASTSYIFSLERWFTFCLENSFIDFRNDFRKRIEEIIIREGY